MQEEEDTEEGGVDKDVWLQSTEGNNNQGLSVCPFVSVYIYIYELVF